MQKPQIYGYVRVSTKEQNRIFKVKAQSQYLKQH